MRGQTWQLAKPKAPPLPRVTEEVRKAVDAKAAIVVAEIKKRFKRPAANGQINWAEDLLPRWHRQALYFVIVMRTPHGQPPTFETHAARMQHAGDGKFDYAIPMRQGWNTGKRNVSVEECLGELRRCPFF